MFYRIKAAIKGYFFKLDYWFFKRKYIYENVKISYSENINFGYKSSLGFNTIINADGKYINIGKESIIQHNTVIELFGGFCDIQDNVSIGVGSFLSCNGGIKIGKFTRIGPRVTLIAASHSYNNHDIPIFKQEIKKKGITIGSNVWIGSNVTILDGSIVEDNVIIAAGTVVNGKRLNSGVIYGGVPVKKLKEIE